MTIHQRAITVDEAIALARRDRDQLLAGARLIERLSPHASDDAYRQFQEQLAPAAPDVQNTAWGHKYFCLLFPDRISDFHVVWHQQLQLIRMLEIPPKPTGRYVCEGRFVAIAEELDLPVHTAGTVIYGRYEAPHAYWRFDIGGERRHWDAMCEGAFLALGWPEVGDLTSVLPGKGAKETIRQALVTHYGAADSAARAQLLVNLGKTMNVGDFVVVTDGGTALAIGKVAEDYLFASGDGLPHRRAVEWNDVGTWSWPRPASAKTLLDTVDYSQDAASLVAVERRLLDMAGTGADRKQRCGGTPPPPPLTGIPARIQEALEHKGQVIVYGPPGTGKTYWALHTARELAARDAYGAPFAALSADQQRALLGDGAEHAVILFCTFHPGYSYEDFIEGYRPVSADGQMRFEQRPGIFKQLCADADDRPDRRFYLLIDEINRGDIPRIFGELLTLLEKDKRGLPVSLPVSGQRFHVPANIHVIGTMNTADRSIALLDTALRRRFAFIELMPDSGVLGDANIAGIPLGPWLDALNQRIRNHVGRDARNLQIGHAYLLDHGQPVATFPAFVHALRDDILPLLEEYCYENYAALASILGSSLVDVTDQRFHDELFAPGRQDDLVRALLEPSPEITASPQAVRSGDGETAEGDETDDAAAGT